MLARRVASVLLTAAIAAGCAACSASEDPGPSKPVFVKKATAVCEATKERIRDESEDLDPDDPSALDAYIRFVSDQALAQIDAIRAIGIPKDERSEIEDALDTYQRNFEKWQEEPETASTAGTDKRLLAATETLEDYGLEACGPTV